MSLLYVYMTWNRLSNCDVSHLLSLLTCECVLLHFYSNSWSHIGDFAVRRGMEEDNSSAMMKTFSLCKILQMHDVVNCTTNIKEMDWINFANHSHFHLKQKVRLQWNSFLKLCSIFYYIFLYLKKKKKKLQQNALQNVIFNNEFNF